MKVNKENAIKLWNEQIGQNKNEYKDYSGRLIKKSEFGNQNSEYGWNIDHIQPVSINGSSKKENLIICNIKTNSDKANKTAFKTNGKNFQVKRKKGTSNYEITLLKEDKSIIKEKEKKKKDNDASKFWKEAFGSDETAKDFANRQMRISDYNKPENNCGWNVIPANYSIPLSKNNFVVANLISIRDKNNKNSFSTNNHDFEVRRSNGKYKIVSKTFLSSKYDLASLDTYFSTRISETKNSSSNYIGYIVVHLKNVKESSKVTAIAELLDEAVRSGTSHESTEILSNRQWEYSIIMKFDCSLVKNFNVMLDCAILFNTYKKYLIKKYNYQIGIVCDIYELTSHEEYYQVKLEQRQYSYFHSNSTNFYLSDIYSLINNYLFDRNDTIFIGKLVTENITDKNRKESLKQLGYQQWSTLDFIYTNLYNEIEEM